MWWMSLRSWTSIMLKILIIQIKILESLMFRETMTSSMSSRIESVTEASISKERFIVMILVSVIQKMLKKEMLNDVKCCYE